MSELLPPELDDEPTPDERPRLPFRWQVIVLALGLAMIVGGGLYLVLNAAPVADAPAPPPEVGAVDVVQSQDYSEAIVGQPVLVNPLLATSQADRDLSALIYAGLTRVDEYGQPIPDMASEWTVSDDGLTYTFTLRDGITWHDGAPFTADDVAFTMEVLRDPEFPGPADLAAFWRSVETYARDAHTVEFVLTAPLTAFPEYASIGILPRHLLAGVAPADLAADSFNLAPVGTGRLRWVSSEAPEEGTVVVRLEPFAGFYDAGRRVGFDSVTLRFYAEPADAFRALGPEAQALGGLDAAELDAILGSAAYNVYSMRLPTTAMIVFNQGAAERLPFFQDVAVRRALTAALDRAAIVQTALPREAALADSPLLPGTWAYTADNAAIPYDPAGAGLMLDEAGWVQDGGTRAREGQAIRFTLLVTDRPSDQAIGESVVAAWQALGVDVELEVLTPEELMAQLAAGADGQRAYDAALVEFGQGRLADPDPYPFWHDSQVAEGQNIAGLSDRDISEALEIARRDSNGVRRADLYRQFQQVFNERAAAIVLYNPLYNYAVSCQVQNVRPAIFVGPADRFRNMDEWRIASADELGEACPDLTE